MGSPYFDFGGGYDDPQESDFYQMLQRIRTQPETDFGSFLPPNDPEVLNYQKLVTDPTGSEDIVSDYMGRQPMYQNYKPSLGRKLAAIALGALSGDPARAYTISRSFINEPFDRATKEWQAEGTNVRTRARLMDAERQRELAGAKYGLQNRVSQLRADETAKARKATEARLLTQRVMAEDKAKRDEADREEQQAFRNNLSKMIFEANQAHRAFMEDNARQTQERLRQESLQRAKQSEEDDLIKKNKQLEAFASTMGISPNDYGNVADIARAIAFKKAMSNPAFADLIQQGGPEDEEPFTIITPDYGTDRVRILQNYLKSLEAKYLRGEFK